MSTIFTSKCVCSWRDKAHFSMNSFSQYEHLNGLMSLCFRRCLVRLQLLLKLFPQPVVEVIVKHTMKILINKKIPGNRQRWGAFRDIDMILTPRVHYNSRYIFLFIYWHNRRINTTTHNYKLQCLKIQYYTCNKTLFLPIINLATTLF